VERSGVLVGRSSQAKGRGGELELAKILQAHGYDVSPGKPMSYGEEPDLSGLPMVHCEVKRCEQIRLADWMQQARQDAMRFQDGLPAIFFRKSRSKWCVVMELEDWLQIYKGRGCKCNGRCGKSTGNPGKE